VLLIDQIVKIWVKQNFAITESRQLVPGFIQLYFIENRGMAFGTTLGDGIWPKYILSLFRFGAIIGIAIYIKRLIVENEVNLFFLTTIALIFAGAAGNLLDGVFYDGYFGIDSTIRENWLLNEFGMPIHGANGEIELREGGVLLGSVVDMFQFTFKWPSWIPFGFGGKEAFPFVFNVADAAISVGVGMLVLRYRKFFNHKTNTGSDTEEEVAVS
jgi:signal peptidase II